MALVSGATAARGRLGARTCVPGVAPRIRSGGHLLHPAQRFLDGRNGARQRVSKFIGAAAIDLTGPLVHEDLLEFEREDDSSVGVSRVRPGCELPPAEADVLADVERADWGASGRERLDEGIRHGAEPLAVQRAGTDVDFGVLRGGGLCGVRAIAPVIVRVDVEHHEWSARGDSVEASTPLGVEGVVHL